MDWIRLYQGFLATPPLWIGTLNGLEQFEVSSIKHPKLQTTGRPEARLGTLAEHFTFDYWSNFPELKIIEKNVQIQGIVATLGELDAILTWNEEWIHVEIAYKIYLYAPNHGTSPLEHWIGPNRKDTLVEKLDRLEQHQIPLIRQSETKQLLESKAIPTNALTSKTWVKGLLFTPEDTEIDFAPLNPACKAGVYMNLRRLKSLENVKLFLPHKLEWMTEPHAHVRWKNLKDIIPLVKVLHEKNYAPMLWAKQANGELSRFFVIWW